MKTENIEYIKGDCIEVMSRYPDNYFDIAIVDPPYGINADQRRGDTGRNGHIKQKDYHVGNWDAGIPESKYFEELRRVSKEQIIWGGNYFLDYLGATSCFLVWDKDNGDNLYADCELAWCSFSTAVRKVKFKWHGFLQGDMSNKENRIHPTQKPMKLYRWIYDTYCQKDWRVLDTHLGSGSNAIAAHYFGIKEFVGVEIDSVYYEQSVARFKNETIQKALW